MADILVQTGVVKINFTDPFLWTSGIKSPIYCDCRELISLPTAREHINEALVDIFHQKKLEPDAVAGTATAGIPWAAFVAQKIKIPLLYVRSKPKSHGAGKLVEGRLAKKKNIIVVEDALSTAESSLQSVKALRNELDANVSHVFALFSWDTAVAKVAAKKLDITLYPLTIFSEIVTALAVHEKITPDQKLELERFHQNPATWWNG